MILLAIIGAVAYAAGAHVSPDAAFVGLAIAYLADRTAFPRPRRPLFLRRVPDPPPVRD